MAAYPRCPMCGATGPVGATHTHCACVAKAVFAIYVGQPEETTPMATEQTPATATITVPLTLKLELLTNAIIGAFEGGSTYWLRTAVYMTGSSGYSSPAYADVAFWQDGGEMSLFYDDPNDEESQAVFRVNQEKLTSGAATMAEKFPRHFSDMISENDDAITHDVFLQSVIFGDVIYG